MVYLFVHEVRALKEVLIKTVLEKRERGRVGGKERQEKEREVYGIQSWSVFLQFLIWIQ